MKVLSLAVDGLERAHAEGLLTWAFGQDASIGEAKESSLQLQMSWNSSTNTQLEFWAGRPLPSLVSGGSADTDAARVIVAKDDAEALADVPTKFNV